MDKKTILHWVPFGQHGLQIELWRGPDFTGARAFYFLGLGTVAR